MDNRPTQRESAFIMVRDIFQLLSHSNLEPVCINTAGKYGGNDAVVWLNLAAATDDDDDDDEAQCAVSSC